MKKTTDLIFENIDNLTSLWRVVGQAANTYHAGKDFDFSSVPYSGWPNRLWFHHDINEHIAEQAREISLSSTLTIPYWDVYQSSSYKILEAKGFEKRFEQIGMSLELTGSYQPEQTIQIRKVTGQKDAKLWEMLFQQSFGYIISHKLLLHAYENTSFNIAYYNQTPIGTVVLHRTSDAVMGIHAMGIIPEMRKRGFAEQLMKLILQNSAEQGIGFATLQASAMGLGLYLKLGFIEQFVMKNYVLAL